jgi:3'(2'), 5'-bisphosphate nucleotidase
LLDILKNIVFSAGEKVMEIYHSADFKVETKNDGSFLTIADRAANKIISSGLKQYFPNIPILSEEGQNIPYSIRKRWNKFFLVDPLDGTREFIKRNGEFTLNIALIEDQNPVAGVVYAPAINTYYAAEKLSSGCWLRDNSNSEIIEKKYIGKRFRVVASRSHSNMLTKKFIKEIELKYGSIQMINMGSSLKICLVAEGKADIYPRLAPTMEWDIAAGHAIALASGCSVLDYETNLPITYNKKKLVNPFFIVKNLST